MEKRKKKYTSPQVDVTFVEMEHAILASSATISGGVNGADYIPEVDEWGTEENGGYTNGDI